MFEQSENSLVLQTPFRVFGDWIESDIPGRQNISVNAILNTPYLAPCYRLTFKAEEELLAALDTFGGSKKRKRTSGKNFENFVKSIEF